VPDEVAVLFASASSPAPPRLLYCVALYCVALPLPPVAEAETVTLAFPELPVARAPAAAPAPPLPSTLSKVPAPGRPPFPPTATAGLPKANADSP
jgi:hypothetical protein